MAKQAGFTFRTDAEKLKIFSALCTLHDTTPTAFFRECIDRYIEEHVDEINLSKLMK